MSKIRTNLTMPTTELAPAEGDLRGYVVFTQLRAGGPFIYAGWLDAADDEMALVFAKEHYGQDQKCTHIWAAPRERIGGLRENADAAHEAVGADRAYQIFTQAAAGDPYLSSERVTATSAASAIDLARRTIAAATEANHLWAIPVDDLIATDDDDLIWRFTDQTYRLARGYSKSVRSKWEAIRGQSDLTEYEKDDLKDTF